MFVERTVPPVIIILKKKKRKEKENSRKCRRKVEFHHSGRLPEQTDFLANMRGVLDSIVEKENATCVAVESRPKCRKSCREKRPTQKMTELLEQEMEKLEEKFTVAYGKWKVCVKEVRTKLKCECSKNDLCNMMDATQRL